MAKQDDSANDEGLEMLSRLFEEEISEPEMLEQLILPVPSSVEEQLHWHYEDVLTRNEELKSRNEELESRLAAMEQKNKMLQEKNDLLRNNLTALYRMSMAKIRFQNLQIASQRKQLQLTVAERRILSDSDQSICISKQNIGSFHGLEDQQNVSRMSRPELITSIPDCCSKGVTNTDRRRHLTTDTCLSELNLGVSSSCSVDCSTNNSSSFSVKKSSSNTIPCGVTVSSSIISGTDTVSVHALAVGNEAPVSSGVTMTIQPAVSEHSLHDSEDQESRIDKPSEDIVSVLEDSLLLPCSSESCSAPDVFAHRGVESEPSLLPIDQATNSDLTTSSLHDESSSGVMLKVDREEKSKAKESMFGEKSSVEIKTVKQKLLHCTTAISATAIGASKSNVTHCKETPSLTNKEFQSDFTIHIKPKEISVHSAKNKHNQITAEMETGVSSEGVGLTDCIEERNEREIPSTVQLSKTDTSKQNKGLISNSLEKFKQSDFLSTPSNKAQDSDIKNTTQKEILLGQRGIAKEISFSSDKACCPSKEKRIKEISSSYTGRRKDSTVEENMQVESSSHSVLQEIDSAVEKPQLQEVEAKNTSKTSSENVGDCCETSESETLLDNDLRLKLMKKSSNKSKADGGRSEGATAAFDSRLSKNKKRCLERELQMHTGKEGIHKEHSTAEKTAPSGQFLHSSHQEKSIMEENSKLSYSVHRSHRVKSERGDALVSSRPAKVQTRNDFRKQESVVENEDQRQTSRESDNSKRTDDINRKRKLSSSDAELPAKKCRNDESIQERLVKLSTMSHDVSEQPDIPPEENSLAATHDQKKQMTSASNAKKLPKTPELICGLLPEIDQLKCYIGMAERRDVAQKISQKEAHKRISSLVVEKKVLDSNRVTGNVPLETALQSASGSNQKKSLDDNSKPSLTIFTMRSLAKLKQSSLSKADKQIRQSLEKGNSKQDYSILTVGKDATHNPPDVNNLITSTLVVGNSKTVSMATGHPKLACSFQNEKLMVTSEDSDISAVVQQSLQKKQGKSLVNIAEETSRMPSSSLKKPAHQKPAQSEILNTQAVQGAISNTPASVQSVETGKPRPSEGISQKKSNSQDSHKQDLMNKTNINVDGSIFESHTRKRNKEVKRLLDGRFLDTKQNDDAETVSRAEQHKRRSSRQETAPNNFLQASQLFNKPLCSSTPVQLNSDLYIGTKVSNAIHSEDIRNTFSGEEVLSDFDVGVPQTEGDSQNHSFDFLFDMAITGATPAHVGDFENENTNISFDQDFFASFASAQLDNSTADIAETKQGSRVGVTAGDKFPDTESDIVNCSPLIHATNDDDAENLGKTRNLEENLIERASSFHRAEESNVIGETPNSSDNVNEQVETTVMIGNLFSSNPGFCSDKEMDLDCQNLVESNKTQNPWMQQVDKEIGGNETCGKNLDISDKITKWPTTDVELLVGNENQNENPSPQSNQFKFFLHNSDTQSENGLSTPEKPSSSFSLLPCEPLLKETANLSPARSRKSLQSDEIAAPGNFCDGAFSDSDLLQVHAPEENFDLCQSDTNDRLFGSISESPSSLKSPDLEDGAEGESKTELKATKSSLNALEIEEGEISDSERDYSVDQEKRKKSIQSGQVLCDERSRAGCLTKKRSFTGWHSHGHQYGKIRMGNFSRETTRSEGKQLQNNRGSQMEPNSKAKNIPRSRSPETITRTQSVRNGRVEEDEGDATRHSKNRKDQTRSQERSRPRYSQEHNSSGNHHKHRHGSHDYHSNATRRVAKRRQTKS